MQAKLHFYRYNREVEYIFACCLGRLWFWRFVDLISQEVIAMKQFRHLLNLIVISSIFLALVGAPLQPTTPTAQAAAAAPTATISPPTLVFEGIQRNENTNPADTDVFPVDYQFNDPRVIGAVPDTSGAPGHVYYMQAVNEMIALYRKNGVLVEMSSFADLWSFSNGPASLTACGTGDYHHGQPYVVYDHMARRWVVVDVAYANLQTGPYYLCIAVSKGNGPDIATPYFTDTYWYYYSLSANNGNYNYYPDSPKMGLWGDGYYLSVDLYHVDSNGYHDTPRGVKVWAMNREDMIQGFQDTFRFVSFVLDEELGYEHLVPSNLSGNPAPSNTPNYFAAIEQGRLYIWELHADWNNLSFSTFGFGSTHNPNYTFDTDTGPIWANGYIIPEYTNGNSPEQLEAHGERLMSPLQFRIVDGVATLWMTHAVRWPASNNIVGMRWYEFRIPSDPPPGPNPPYLYQYGTYAPNDSRYRWMGSLAVDRAGNMALGFSSSGTTSYPDIRYTGRLRSDPIGTMPMGEQLLKLGSIPTFNGSQYDNDSVYDGPWGRQSQMMVDPLDECIFWYTNMYYGSDSQGYDWHTAVGWFSFPQCKGGAIRRISLDTNDVEGNKSSGLDFEMYSAGISGDGRYVVFSSEATNLVANDTNGNRDVFLRDRDTDADGIYDEPGFVLTTRISVCGYNCAPVGNLNANADSWEVAISTNGNVIAFTSDASNLVSGDGNGSRDVFIYNRTTGITQRVSVPDGTINGNGNGKSEHPFLNEDGSVVVFRSYASNLIIGDGNTYADIFVRDVPFNHTYRVPGAVVPDGESAHPTISGDGRWIAFSSLATNLVADNPNVRDVFLYDRLTGVTVLASGPAGTCDDTGTPLKPESFYPYISGNGQYVAFASRCNLDNFAAGDADYDSDIFVYNALDLSITRVSISFFGDAANRDSFAPSISWDGRYVAFASNATNLDVNLPDVNAARDVFLYDRLDSDDGSAVFDYGLVSRISLDYNREEPDDWSFAPVIAPFGRHIAFVSEATDLVVNDHNYKWDVFAYDSERTIPTFLTIPGNILGVVGQPVFVPVIFNSNGLLIDSTTFSVDFDQNCLSFDNAAANAVVFTVPAGFSTGHTYNASDTDGEIDINIVDNSPPYSNLVDGTIVTLRFVVKATCQPAPGAMSSARVGFSSDPKPSFGSRGQSILGYANDGFVYIQTGTPGDCNGDSMVNAGDISALVLEIFDGDGNLPGNVPNPTFPGNPVGCNPNQDFVVDAGDLSCLIQIIWYGAAATCDGSSITGPLELSIDLATKTSLASTQPELKIAGTVPARPGERVVVPVRLQTQGSPVNSLIFSIDFDQTWLNFNPADANGDGIPDAVSFLLPAGYFASAVYEPTDLDGELDVVLFPPSPAAVLDDGLFMSVAFTAGGPAGSFVAQVRSSNDPAASFGSVNGQSLAGLVQEGAVWINDWLQVFLPTLRR
jgi:Tol biopolymer transport system component